MPEYTQHERAALHAKARQQIRFVTLAATQEATEHRRFLALGYLLALSEAELLRAEDYQALQAELQNAAHDHADALYRQTVHCTGHVDYAPVSRILGPRGTPDEPWHTAARVEQKRRLDLQLFDYKQALGHATYYEAWKTAGLVMGSIGELQGYGLLEPAEVAEYQAQVRSAFAEAQPADLEMFDQLWMWDPHQ